MNIDAWEGNYGASRGLPRKKEFDVIGFDEVMLRLSPPNKGRISQGEVFEKGQAVWNST